MKNVSALMSKYYVFFASLVALFIGLPGQASWGIAGVPSRLPAPTSTLTQPRYCFDYNVFTQDFGPAPANPCPPSSPVFFPTALETTQYASSNNSPNAGFGAYGVSNDPSCFNNVFFRGSDYPAGHGSFLIVDSRDNRYSPATSVYTRSLLPAQLPSGVYELRFWMRNAIPVSPPAYGSRGPDLPECPDVQLKDGSGAIQTGRLVGADYTTTANCPGFPMQPLNNSGPNYGWKELVYLFENVSGACESISIIPRISSTYGGADFVLDDIAFNKLKNRTQTPAVTKHLFAYSCGGQSPTSVNLNFDSPNAARVYSWRDQTGAEIARISGSQMPYTVAISSSGAFPRTFTVTDVTDVPCSSEPASVIVDAGPADKSITVCTAGNNMLYGPDPNQVYEWFDESEVPIGRTSNFYFAPLSLPIQRFKIKAVVSSGCLSINFGTVTTRITPNLLFYDEFDPAGWPSFPTRYIPGGSSPTYTEYQGRASDNVSMWYKEVVLTNRPQQFDRYWRGGPDGVSFDTHCGSTLVGTFFLFMPSNLQSDADKAVWGYRLGPLSNRLDSRAGPSKAYEVRFILRSAADDMTMQCPNVALKYFDGTTVQTIQGHQIANDNSYLPTSCQSSSDQYAFRWWQEMRYIINVPNSLDLTSPSISNATIGIYPAITSGLESIELDRVEVYNFNGESVQPIVTTSNNFLCTDGNMQLYVDNTVAGNVYQIMDEAGNVIQPSQTVSTSGARITFNVTVNTTTNFYIRNATTLGAYPNYAPCPSSCEPPRTKVTVQVSAPYILSTMPDVDDQSRCGAGQVTFRVKNALPNRDYEWLDMNYRPIHRPGLTSSGDRYTTFSPNLPAGSTVYYYVRLADNPTECPALVKLITGNTTQIEDPSTTPVVADQTRCGAGRVTFQVTNPVGTRNYEWLAANGTTVVHGPGVTADANNDHYRTFSPNLVANAATNNTTTYYVQLSGNAPGCYPYTTTVRGTANIVDVPAFNIVTATSGQAPYFRGNVISYAITNPPSNLAQSITYQWNWGDFSPAQTTFGSTMEHQFTRAGTFLVQVLATQTFANSSPVCRQVATLPIVIREPLCELTVPVAGTFSNNAASGAINYVNNAACAPTYTFECLGGQPQTVPGVVSFSATAFADTLVRNDNNYYQGVFDSNPFLAGQFRVRPYATYSYSTQLDGQTNNFNAGTFTLPVFDWQSSARARPTSWLTPAVATKMSPDGDVLEERDPLGIPSVAKFAYGRAQANLPLGSSSARNISTHALPYLQAHNAESGTVIFESFENLVGACPALYGDDYMQLSCSELLTTSISGSGSLPTGRPHTGQGAAQLAPIVSNGATPSKTWRLTLKSLPITSQVQTNGLLIKVWVYNPDKLPGTVELIDMAEDYTTVVSAPLSSIGSNGMEARSGDWALYSATIQVGAGLVPANYYLAPRVVFTGSSTATSAVWVDDIRVQPANAQMTTYVYDPQSFRLVASFDDQHFGLLYQYNAEGKLIRKQVETERGLKTIQETQYNTAKMP